MAATLTSDNEITYASFPIEKVETDADGNVTVWGKATDDSLDSDQQIIDPEFAAKAMAEFFESGPNIRVQHQAQRDPAGVGISFERDGTAHWMKSRIIEPVAKQLVLGGALRAYSVGIARPTIQRDSMARGGRITDGQFVEISLVDRPANKNCGIQLVKGIDKSGNTVLMTKVFGQDTLAKSDNVTISLPADVQIGFSPADLARIVARRNGNGIITKTAEPDVGKGKKKKALRAAAAAAGVVPDDEKQGTAISPGTSAVSSPQSAPASMKDDDDEVDARVHAHLEDTLNALNEAIHDQDLDYQHEDDEDKCLDGPVTDMPSSVAKRKLTSRARRALPSSSFVFPEERKYPIHDRSHARNALARVSQHGTPDEKARVRAAVARRYPGIEQEKKTQKKLAKAARKQGGPMGGAAVSSPQSAPASMKKDKSVCPACGAMQNSKHAFCTECGKAMIGAPEIAKNHDFLCLKCGYELDKGEKFCPNCGAKNPGYNPMADLKIPANKSIRSGVGRKAKLPFGGRQAPQFGKDPDGNGDDDARKQSDAPLTSVKKKKVKPGKDVPTGTTPGSAGGAVGAHERSVPGHRAGGGELFDRDAASKGADLAVATSMRLKALGIGHDMGYAHDLSCPAFSWDDVSKAYPAGLDNLNADTWQRKALEAASSAPLAEAQAASQLGQAVFTIKAAAYSDLVEVKRDINKAFRDANPGPGSAPTPGHIEPHSYRRPKITAGRASYGAHYDEFGISASVPSGEMSASGYHRPPLSAGHESPSPANKSRAPVPSPNGVPVNLDYSSIHKEQILRAFTAMHDHFDRVFPGVCPMNAPATRPASRPVTVKVKKGSDAGFAALTEAVIALPDTIKGEVVNALAGQPANAPAPELDRKTITDILRKSQKTSDKKFSALTDAVSILAEQSARSEPQQPAFDQQAIATVLRKAQKASDKRFMALTDVVSALPGTIKEEVASALPGTTQPALDPEAVANVLRKAQKTSDKRFLALTEAISALPEAIKSDAATAAPALDQKALTAVLRKAQKTSNEKIMALTEAVSVLAEQPGPAQPGIDRKTIAAVVRKAQKASDRKITALTKDRKTLAVALRKAQATSDKKIAALTKAISAPAAPAVPNEPAQAAPKLDRKAIAAVLRKAQKNSDKRFAALTNAVSALADQQPSDKGLDRKAVAALLRKTQRESNEKLAALTAAVSALTDRPSYRGAPLAEVVPVTPRRAKASRPAGAKVAALKKAQKAHDERLAALTKAYNALADQPDPATQAFKGMALNPLRDKPARPAGVQSVAEIAERTQAMMLHELEAQWRNSTDPVQREAAWNASLKMRGLRNDSDS